MGDWDVIVVGAGPGGTTAARGLAQRGLRTLLIEKEKFPRYKPCGGGLTAKVKKILDVDFSSAVQDTIHAISVAYGAARTQAQPMNGWCVMRDEFDAILAQSATRAGATFRDDAPISNISFDDAGAKVTTRGETLRARFIVGADGVNGVTRKAMKIPPHKNYSIALETEMDAPSGTLEKWRGIFHMDYSAMPWGYAWIFPKADHLSVGIGSILRTARGTHHRTALAQYIANEPSLKNVKERFTRGYRIPISRGFGKYDTPHAVLVGDAAGIVEPFTGEGIYYAIRSGQIAAEEIGRAFERGQTGVPEYSARVNREINSDFRAATIFAEIFYRAPRFAAWVFRTSALARQAAVEMVSVPGNYRGAMVELIRRILVR